MSTSSIAQAIRDTGMIQAIVSDEDKSAIKRAAQTIDPFNVVRERSITAFRTPMTFNWGPSSVERQRTARAGRAVLVATHATTAPSSGPLIVRISQETPGSGETIIWTTYHPAGQKMFEDPIAVPILSGSWLSVSIPSTGGASGVSVSVVVNVG